MRPFPDDLAQAQQEWSATYRQLAERPGRTELSFHPYGRHWRHWRDWQHWRPSPAARWALRDLEQRDVDVSELLPQ
ncbi:hypothetical protein OHB06_24960 [Streptomyces sp. NBC_01604]